MFITEAVVSDGFHSGKRLIQTDKSSHRSIYLPTVDRKNVSQLNLSKLQHSVNGTFRSMSCIGNLEKIFANVWSVFRASLRPNGHLWQKFIIRDGGSFRETSTPLIFLLVSSNHSSAPLLN